MRLADAARVAEAARRRARRVRIPAVDPRIVLGALIVALGVALAPHIFPFLEGAFSLLVLLFLLAWEHKAVVGAALLAWIVWLWIEGVNARAQLKADEVYMSDGVLRELKIQQGMSPEAADAYVAKRRAEVIVRGD